MTARWLAAVLLAAILAPWPVAADHPGLRSGPGNPLIEALIWAGGAFLVGIAIVAIVTILARRRSPSE